MKKHQTNSPFIRHRDRVYKVNSGPQKPIFTHQLRKILEQLDALESHHYRVLVVLFNLHMPFYTIGNQVMTKFLNKVRYDLSKHYKLTRLGYTWCRERNNADNQHYHFVLMIDGSKVQHPKKLLRILREIWYACSNGGHLQRLNNCFYLLKRGDEMVRAEVTYRISYLAKVNTKQSREGLTNDYGCSRLKSVGQ
ncbi:YagK/YfjJ domain-containing protein [Vibrio tubiashii]|nr:inovirus-type Gp2 protein [Vibrio tubiashii]